MSCDASDEGCGAVLQQKMDNQEQPIGYFSKKFNDAERRYSITEREGLAVVAAVNHFAPYLYGNKFVIITDHKALKYLFKNK
ncbi:hypothetical protein FHG87_003892, partial [Trinorchestia longiramus]